MTPRPEGPLQQNLYSAAVLVMLTSVYASSYIDRSILSVIAQPLKVDLALSDTQIGLLGGLYFALLYTILGVPIARLAERFSRVSIISVSVLVWSAFTALSGVAAGFTQLAIFRFGVGVGEAGGSPSAHSLISDYYPPDRRASALAVYSAGSPIGILIGSILGGTLAALSPHGWRLAFFAAGAPGFLIAGLVRLAIKEPERGRFDSHAELKPAPQSSARRSLAAEFGQTLVVARSLFGRWPILNMVLGITIGSISVYGLSFFLAAYFARAFHLGFGQIGLIVAVTLGVSTSLGTLLGGVLSDRAARHGAYWYALIPALGFFTSAASFVFGFLQSDWRRTALCFFVGGLFGSFYLAPTCAVVQNAVRPHQRATATALLFLSLNLIGLSLGPLLVGWLVDHLLAGFARARELRSDALSRATGEAMIIVTGFFIWGGLHYLLSMFGLRKALAALSAHGFAP